MAPGHQDSSTDGFVGNCAGRSLSRDSVFDRMAGRLAGPDGGGHAVHGSRPVADQHGPDVAVVQDDVAAAAVHGEPVRPTLLPFEALRAGLGGSARSVLAGVREGRVGTAGWPPTVVFHPVRDRVAVLGWLVVRPAESPPDFIDEPLLLIGAAGG